MARYKPGDTVIIRDDLVEGVEYRMDDMSSGIGVNALMIQMGGMPCTIATATQTGRYYILEDDMRWVWTDEMFVGRIVKLDDLDIEGDCGFFE